MELFLKYPNKAFGVFVPQRIADLRHGLIRVQQQMLRPAYSQRTFPIAETLAGGGLDQPGAIGDGKSKMLGYIGQGDIRQMLLDIVHHQKIIRLNRDLSRKGALHRALAVAHNFRSHFCQHPH